MSVIHSKDGIICIVKGFSRVVDGVDYYTATTQNNGKTIELTLEDIKTGNFEVGRRGKAIKPKKNEKLGVVKNDGSLTILALDMATMKTGYTVSTRDAVIECKHIDVKGEPVERMYKMKNSILDLIDKYNVGHVCVEDIYLGSNGYKDVDVFKKLAGMQYVLLVALREANIGCTIYTAAEWRKLAGYSNKSRERAKESALAFAKGITTQEDSAESLGISRAFWNSQKVVY